MLKQRSTLSIILLSLITGGIYYYYWVYTVTTSMNRIENCADYRNPGTTMLLYLFVPFYAFYWTYTFGNSIQANAKQYNIHIKDSGSTYLLWFILGSFLFGLGPIISIVKFISNYNYLVAGYNESVLNPQK